MRRTRGHRPARAACRPRRTRRALLLAFGAVVLTGCIDRDAPAPGRAVPSYQARTLEGERVSLAELRGETVVLNVWATWCEPCRREMPALERLHREMGAQGVRVVAVSVDGAGAAEDMRVFLAEHGITFTILHDPAGTIQRRWALRGVPETFLIGADGTLRRHWIGRIDPGSTSVRHAIHDAIDTPQLSAAFDYPM